MPATPTSRLLEENGTLTLSFHCRLCGQPSFLNGIDPERYALYVSGAYAQDAFPSLTPGQRETLISGSHEACFDEAFPQEPEMTEDDILDALTEVVESDRPFLLETWRAVAACPQDAERSSLWPADYDPISIVVNAGAPPEHVAIALVNIRQAAHPGESWGKCPNCGLISSVAGAQTVCSEGCFRAYAASL